MDFEITSSKIIKRITVEGPLDQQGKVLRLLFDKGYISKRTGPKVLDFPELSRTELSKTTFYIVAEKELDLTMEKSSV
jgi:hypothetical protein